MITSVSINRAGRWSGNFGLGVLVILLYALFVMAVFGGFASYMTRSAWSTEAKANDPAAPDLDGMFHLIRREDALKLKIGESRAELDGLQQLLDEALDELDQIPIERAVVDVDLRHAALLSLSEMRGIVGSFTDDAAEKVNAVLSATNVSMTSVGQVGKLMNMAPDLDLNADLDAEAVQKVQDILIRASDRMGALDRTIADLDSRQMTGERLRDRHTEAMIWPEQQLSGFEDELVQLEEKIGPNAPERARIGGIKHIFWGVPYLLVGFPTIFLTLLVTIAAGGLGAVVAFSRTILRDGGGASMSSLLVSVGEGIAAAMAIFLFSGAGMLALAHGTEGATSLELSPYTVAFVAFISGFMAEDAFARIQGAGRRYFAAPEGENPTETPVATP